MKRALLLILLAMGMVAGVYDLAHPTVVVADGTDPMPACRGQVCPPAGR